MSGKRRIVTLVVTDDLTDVLHVRRFQAGKERDVLRGVEFVPVPSDDQLTRDLDAAIGALHFRAEHAARQARFQEKHGASSAKHATWMAEAREHRETAARLRAAFHLEERPGLDDVLSHGRARFNLGTEDG